MAADRGEAAVFTRGALLAAAYWAGVTAGRKAVRESRPPATRETD